MNKLFFILIIMFTFFSCAPNQQSAQIAAQNSGPQTTVTVDPAAEISFTFTRQSGAASNQYAIWIEDAQGQYVKTIFATRWTANGGYKNRPTSIPLWVKQSKLSTIPKTQVDAVSGATPPTSSVTYKWDGTDYNGAAAAAGDYVLILEGTLRWENQAYYRAPIALGQGAAAAQVSVEYTGARDTNAERAMFRDVRVRVLR